MYFVVHIVTEVTGVAAIEVLYITYIKKLLLQIAHNSCPNMVGYDLQCFQTFSKIRWIVWHSMMVGYSFMLNFTDSLHWALAKYYMCTSECVFFCSRTTCAVGKFCYKFPSYIMECLRIMNCYEGWTSYKISRQLCYLPLNTFHFLTLFVISKTD